MSCCLIFQESNRIFMGADTAISTMVDGEFYRVSNNQQKIFRIFDSLVFCSGNMGFVENVLGYIQNLSVLDVCLVSKYLKGIDFPKEKDIYNVEIIIALNGAELYQLSEYNDFDVVCIENPKDKIRILSGGIRTEDCLDFAEKEMSVHSDVLQAYENVYQKLSSEAIGGNLLVWEISDQIKLHYCKPIPEKDINYIPFGAVHAIVADEIKGRILAGNQLTVADENNQFILDASGLRMTNAKFTLIGNSDKNRIILNPDEGIKIQKLVGTNFIDQFYVDNAGNLNFAGDVSGVSGTFSGFVSAIGGTIGGWRISSDGLRDNRGNYILSNGNIRLGALYINGNEFIFSGDFYADNLYGELVTPQFGNWSMTNSKFGEISADKITTGTFLADRIYGGTIRWPGVTMGTTETGISQINAEKGIDLVVGQTVINAREDIINLSATQDIVFGDHTKRPKINMKGHLLTLGANGLERGKTDSYGVGGKSSIKIMKFTNGILTETANVTDPAAELGSLSWDKYVYPPVDVINEPLFSSDYFVRTGLKPEVGDIITIEIFGDYEQYYEDIAYYAGSLRGQLYDAWRYIQLNTGVPSNPNTYPLSWETSPSQEDYPVYWPFLFDFNQDLGVVYDYYEVFYSPYFTDYEDHNEDHHYFIGPQIMSQDGAPKGSELVIWQIFTSNLDQYPNSYTNVVFGNQTVYMRIIVTEGAQDTDVWEQDVVFPDDVVAWTDKGAYILTDLDFAHEDELDLEVSGTLHYRTSGSEFYYAFDAVRRAVSEGENATFDQVSGVVDSVYTGNNFVARASGNVYMGMYNGSVMTYGYPLMASEEKTQYEYPGGLPNPGTYRPDHEYVYTTGENIYWDDEFDPPPTNYMVYFNVGDMSNLTFLADNSLHIKVTRRRWVRP